MARPRMPVGAHGTVALSKVAPGKWRARTLYRFDDGRRRQVERFAATRGKAENRLLEALVDIKAPQGRASGTMSRDMTVAALGQAYLASKEGKIAPNTMRTYRHHVDADITPALGALVAAQVKPLRLQEFLDEAHDRAGYSVAFGCRKVLNGMYRLGMLHEVVSSNPVAPVMARVERGHHGATALSSDGLAALLEAIRADTEMGRLDVADLLEFMAFTGCRVGEACALRWQAVHTDEKLVDLGASVNEVPHQRQSIQEPGKTDAAQRTIVVADRVVALLEGRREKAQAIDDELVFPSPLGGLRRPTRVAGVIALRRDALGFPKLTSHAFRKTLATEMDRAGLSAREIAEYLGHKRPSMTQDVYMGRDVRSPGVADALNSKFGVSSGSRN